MLAALGTLAALPIAWCADRPPEAESDVVRVVVGASPSEPEPRPAAALIYAATPAAGVAPHAAILRALRMQASGALVAVSQDDPRVGSVCGTVATQGGRASRFVYLGNASMAALDDGGAAFEAMHRRVCGS